MTVYRDASGFERQSVRARSEYAFHFVIWQCALAKACYRSLVMSTHERSRHSHSRNEIWRATNFGHRKRIVGAREAREAVDYGVVAC